MKVTIKNDGPGFGPRVAVLIEKKKVKRQITYVLKGGDSITHEGHESDKITVGQKWEE